MHDEIIRYSMSGEISDNKVLQTKQRLIDSLEGQLRDDGCVPALDMEPQFTLDYRPETQTYIFTLSIYGIHAGSGVSWQQAGMMNGKGIQKSIQRVR